MFRIVVLFACLVTCRAHAVVPLVHTVAAPVVPTLGLGGHGYAHGFSGYSGVGHLGHAGHGFIGHGYASHGLLGHAYGAHHILKRSPHLVSFGHLGGGHGAAIGHLGGVGHLGAVSHLGALGHIAPVAPVAVSHQSRIDVRSSPAFVAPVVQHVALAPSHYGGGHYGGGHYGSVHSHLGHY